MQPFPADYNEAVRQAQVAAQAALADGAKLVEVEFPTASLAAVAGDAEGAPLLLLLLWGPRQAVRVLAWASLALIGWPLSPRDALQEPTK